MTKNLLENFNLNEFNLPDFLTDVSVSLDLLRAELKLDKKDYVKISHASNILREKSRDFRKGTESIDEDLFFWEFYGKKQEESNSVKNRRLYADRLAILSEELSTAPDLEKTEINELVLIISKLSRKVIDYQTRNQYH
jgi:RNA polymerase-interacting CarD/CdnL/TRCF family regulator